MEIVNIHWETKCSWGFLCLFLINWILSRILKVWHFLKKKNHIGINTKTGEFQKEIYFLLTNTICHIVYIFKLITEIQKEIKDLSLNIFAV